jgi:hypothetical protein
MPPPHNILCPTNIGKPEPTGFCDRSGFYAYRRDLLWQYDWRGNALANLRLLILDKFIDEPQPQLKPVIIPGPDPTPVKDPRPGFQVEEMGPTPTFNIESIIGD